MRVEDKRTWNTRDMQERIGALEIQLKDPHMEVMERKLVALPSCFIAIACMWVSTCPEFGLFTAFCFFFLNMIMTKVQLVKYFYIIVK